MTINYLKLKIDLIQSIDAIHYRHNKGYYFTDVCHLVGDMLNIELDWAMYEYITSNKYITILNDLLDDNIADRDSVSYFNHKLAVKLDSLSIGIITESI